MIRTNRQGLPLPSDRRWWRRPRGDAAPAPDPIAEEQARDILAAFERLRTTTAREVMTPRVDVVALELPVTEDDVGRAVRESGHSRFPVYEDDLDHLVGVLFVKDLFRMGDSGPTPELIRRRLRKPFVVPEGRLVMELLQEMRTGRRAFAVVVDEYGGVEGVLTIKDLVSELIGELPDEFDRPEEADVTRIDPARWLLGGQIPIDRVTEELGLDLPEGEYVTLGGFLFDRFGRIPAEGDCLTFDGWEFRVNRMERRRIGEVIVKSPDANGS
jgi:CBS domain containing-hemolysin-like protein